MKTQYLSYDDDPAVLYTQDDGGMTAYVFLGGKWKMVHEAEVFSKGKIYEEKEWREAFGDIPDPPSARAAGAA